MEDYSAKHGQVEGVALIGFRLNPNTETAELFTLMAFGFRDFPVKDDRQVVFFTKPALAHQAYERFPEEIRELGPPPSEVSLVCDIAGALHIIESKAHDDSATVLNCLNTLFDLIDATDLEWSTDYKNALQRLADHLTFDTDLTLFFGEQVSRNHAIDALLWCVGAVTVNAKIIG
jgi:hypothetical protein